MGKHALVIGGSVGGLFAAGLLRQNGWAATIYERSTGDLAGRGAGIGLSTELLDTMRSLGARFDSSLGVPVTSYVWLDAEGAIRHRHPRPHMTGSWGRVFRPLRQSFPDEHYRSGMILERVEQDAKSVTAIFADGTRVTGDLLVAADGSLSTVRRQYLPEVQPRYVGYVAWRGIVNERELSPAAREALTGHISFSFHEREMLLAMSNPAIDEDGGRGERRVYFIWYRPTQSDAELRDLFTDARGVHYGVSIPPPAIRGDLIATLRDRARACFAPAVAEVVQRVSQPLLQAITDLEAPKLIFGRVVLMGDAAFVARPHVAGGITKAALDARRLAEVLANTDDVDSALARYEATQSDFGAKLVAHGRRLGSYVDRNVAPGAERFLDPITIMNEYGAPHLLHDPGRVVSSQAR
jgi:2-polyprenyl-6-methoxyphenol hydroxylase-like FAD-dependent oxidoreductase